MNAFVFADDFLSFRHCKLASMYNMRAIDIQREIFETTNYHIKHYSLLLNANSI